MLEPQLWNVFWVISEIKLFNKYKILRYSIEFSGVYNKNNIY